MPQQAQVYIHLTPDDYDVIGPERFGQPGLVAVESVGPGMPVTSVGPVVTIHDSTFEPRHGIAHHRHEGMERLFYILQGAVDHDDAQNGITGHMGTGDLGILTEGRGGMRHAESNPTDGTTRCWILVYPCEPLVESASFAAIRGEEMQRTEGADWRAVHVVQPGDSRLHGDIRLFVDTTLDAAGKLEFALNPEESAVVFVVDGHARLTVDEEPDQPELASADTVLFPPLGEPRKLLMSARGGARLLHVIMGPGAA